MRKHSGNAWFVEMYDQSILERDFPCLDAKIERRHQRRPPRRISTANRLHPPDGRDSLVLSLFGRFATVLEHDVERPGQLDIVWMLDSDHGAGSPRSGQGRLYLSPSTYEFIVVKLGKGNTPAAAVVCPGQFEVDFSVISSVADVHRFTMKARYGVRATVEAEMSDQRPLTVTLRPILQNLQGSVFVRDDGNDLVSVSGNVKHFIWRRTMTEKGVRYVPFSEAEGLDLVWNHEGRGYILYDETWRKDIVQKLGIVPIEIGPGGFAPPPRYRELPAEHRVAHRLALMRFGGGAPEPVAFANDGAAILRLGGLDGPATLYKTIAPVDFGKYTKQLDPVVADLDGDGTDELYLFWILFEPPVVDAEAVARGEPPRTLGDYQRSAIVQVSIEGDHAVAREMKVDWSKPKPTYVIRYDDTVEYDPDLDEASEAG